MSSRPVIHKVISRWGLVDDPTDSRELKTTVIGQDELSGEVVDAIFDNDLLTAGGVYGILEAGDPVEVTSLQITHDHGVTEITVYNLGIMLFHTNDEIYPRVLRVRSAIERHTEERLQNGRKDEEVSTSLTGPGKQVRAQKGQDGRQVYQIKVALLETEPSIWRRFLVPSSVTLHRLHLILQDVMGWSNYHLYRFKIGSEEYGEPHPDNEFNELNFKNSRRTKLGQVVTKKGKVFQYEYDFGDSWEHMLLVEDILEYQPDMRYPVCLTGERACPPEDCGGPHGYADLLETIADPGHEDYQDMMTWLGGNFDPDAFDIEIVNLKLKSMRV
jgi:hypothetical protein